MLSINNKVAATNVVSAKHLHLVEMGPSADADARLQVGKLQWMLHAALENARYIDTRSFECDTQERLCADHVPVVRAVIEETVVVLNAVIEHYERISEVQQADTSGVFHAVFEDLVATPVLDDPSQRVADVAFMARWELIRKLDGLERTEASEQWELIAACGSALRRVVKAIAGVERVLAEVEGRPSMFMGLYQTQAEQAVLIRKAYVRLTTTLRGMDEQRERLGTNRCLRLVGVALATLVGQEIYEELRAEDRRVLRSLQHRLIDWLRGDRNEREGQRLLQDVSALATLLMDINRRQELIDHDRQVISALLVNLDNPRGDKLDAYERLFTIRGRDAELDALLDEFAELERWRAPASRVLMQLGPG